MPTTDKTLTFTVTGTGSQTVLGISGDRFTINGTPTFLLGCSYFQALNWHQSDITSLQSRGFNWIRIWLEVGTSWTSAQPSLQGNGVFSGASTIQALCDYCDARGIIVEIVLMDWESSPQSTDPFAAIANVTAALKSKGNIFYDVLNEHNLYNGMAHSTLQQWTTAVKAGDPGAIVKTSCSRGHIGGVGAGNTQIITADINADLGTGADLISPHFDRGINWETATTARVANCKSHLVSVGQNKPVLLDEECRFGSEAVSTSVFPVALLNAYNAGAAGWLYHNDKCFNLSGASMFSQFTANDLTVVNGLAAVLPAPSDDWATRTAAPGVLTFNRLDTQTALNTYIFPDTTADHVTLDTTLKPPGAAASAKFAVRNTDGSANGSMTLPLGATFGNGSTVWFSYRVYLQPQEVYAPWPWRNSPEGPKFHILSRYGNAANCGGPGGCSSNQLNEYVYQENFIAGQMLGYHRDAGGGFPPLQKFEANVCNTTDFRSMAAFDLGGNPLTGTNPDTGAAWTSCEQYRARVGSLYSDRGTSALYRQGLGHPYSGGRAFSKPRQWLTFTGRVIIGTFGQANHRLTAWVAPEGQPYTKLWDETGISLGGGSLNSGFDYNGIWLLPYCTNRWPGGRRVASRSGQLSGCFEIWNVSPGVGIGNGTLSYNASTQKFTWQGPGGEPVGAARGFSAANNVLAINIVGGASQAWQANTAYALNAIVRPTAGGSFRYEVTVAGTTGSSEPTWTGVYDTTVASGSVTFRAIHEDSFINGQITPANLPGVNTSETITIADGRPDTQRNYADVIISSQAINAPGGYAPT